MKKIPTREGICNEKKTSTVRTTSCVIFTKNKNVNLQNVREILTLIVYGFSTYL